MYKVSFRADFFKRAKKLDGNLYKKLLDKIELLKDKNNHKSLKVHKLHGKLAKYYSFSLDYGLRTIFRFWTDNEIVLVDIGSHDIYK